MHDYRTRSIRKGLKQIVCYNKLCSVLLYVVSNIVAHSMYATCPLDMMCADTINFSDTPGDIKISFLRLEPETFGYEAICLYTTFRHSVAHCTVVLISITISRYEMACILP
jgi:hypothetical protein